MKIGSITALCVFAAVAHPLAAQEFWSWHSFDFAALRTSRVELTVHSRLRFHSSHVQQGRGGAHIRFNLGHRLAAVGGYYVQSEEDEPVEWRSSHRAMGGLEVPVLSARRVSVTTRGLLERYFPVARPDYSRYRQRVRASARGRVSPYVYGEWFVDAHGLFASRGSGGIRWRTSNWSTVDLSYLYDLRRASAGPPRHVFVTSVLFERPKHDGD